MTSMTIDRAFRVCADFHVGGVAKSELASDFVETLELAAVKVGYAREINSHPGMLAAFDDLKRACSVYNILADGGTIGDLSKADAQRARDASLARFNRVCRVK